MGAQDFDQVAEGKNAREAFRNAKEAAAYEYGHGGYSGTIAEKHEFVMIAIPNQDELPNYREALAYAEHLMEEEDPRIDDPWGPAGCSALKDGRYLFFGLASS